MSFGRRIGIWALPVFGSAIIGVLVKDFWEAPRPTIEIAAVSLQAVDAEKEIDLDPALVGRIQDHVFVENLELRVSTAEVKEAMSDAEVDVKKFKSLIERLDRLQELLRTRSGPIDLRRREFLAAWFAGDDGGTLDSLVKSVLVEHELPDHYRSHPDNMKDISVDLGPSVVSLREVDEERVAQEQSKGSVNTYERVRRDARRTNYLRRLWIHLEPDIFIPTLKRASDFLIEQLEESRAIVAELDEAIAEQNPDHILVTAVLGNRGRRPLGIRHLGALWLRLPSRSASDSAADEVAIPLGGLEESPEITVLEGGGAEVIKVFSRDSIPEMVAKSEVLRGGRSAEDKLSRLEVLMEGGGISAAVSLVKAGVPIEDAEIGRSEFRPVGPQAQQAVFSTLSGAPEN